MTWNGMLLDLVIGYRMIKLEAFMVDIFVDHLVFLNHSYYVLFRKNLSYLLHIQRFRNIPVHLKPVLIVVSILIHY